MMRLSILFLLGLFVAACGATDEECKTSSGSGATQLGFNADTPAPAISGYIPEVEQGCTSKSAETEKCDLLTNPGACKTQ